MKRQIIAVIEESITSYAWAEKQEADEAHLDLFVIINDPVHKKTWCPTQVRNTQLTSWRNRDDDGTISIYVHPYSISLASSRYKIGYSM
jgi:hypothetical protein